MREVDAEGDGQDADPPSARECRCDERQWSDASDLGQRTKIDLVSTTAVAAGRDISVRADGRRTAGTAGKFLLLHRSIF